MNQWKENSVSILESNNPTQDNILLEEANAFFSTIGLQFDEITKYFPTTTDKEKLKRRSSISLYNNSCQIEITVYPYLHNTLEISELHSCLPIQGKTILIRSIEFGHAIDSKTIRLTDMSQVKSAGCLTENIDLALFRILATGKSWYESEPYNFRSDDTDYSNRHENIRNTLFDEFISNELSSDLLEKIHTAFPEIHTEGKMVKDVFTEILNKRDAFTKEQCKVTTILSEKLVPKVKYNINLKIHLIPDDKYSKKGGNKKSKRRRHKRRHKTNKRKRRK